MAELAGESALLVPAREPQLLAAAVETAVTGEPSPEADHRRQLGLAIAARYSWQACAEGHLEAYHLAAGR
jgi:glycosyltransferase involved in cell wall biosynthesis